MMVINNMFFLKLWHDKYIDGIYMKFDNHNIMGISYNGEEGEYELQLHGESSYASFYKLRELDYCIDSQCRSNLIMDEVDAI